MSKMKYKGYEGSCEVSLEDGVVFGKILHIRDLVNYEAPSPAEIRAEFERSVDEYLKECADEGRDPDKPFKGSFNVRIPEALHREIAIEAENRDVTLNHYVTQVLAEHRGCVALHGGEVATAWRTTFLQQAISSRIRKHAIGREELGVKFSAVGGGALRHALTSDQGQNNDWSKNDKIPLRMN